MQTKRTLSVSKQVNYKVNIVQTKKFGNKIFQMMVFGQPICFLLFFTIDFAAIFFIHNFPFLSSFSAHLPQLMRIIIS